MKSPLPVTVIVPTKDEAKNLPGCLASLGSHFFEVIVVDSESTDETPRIAAEHGARVETFRWNGRFPKKRNWALDNLRIDTDWILFLDADERVTGAFLEELRRVLARGGHVGFWLSYDNWFLGQQLRYGDPMRKLALFRRDAGRYERLPEILGGSMDMEIHEHPVLDGSVGTIGSRLQHHDRRGLHSHIARHNEYSTWECRRYFALEAMGGSRWTLLNRRQRFKYRNLHRWWFADFYAVVCFIWKFGFLDGRAGWLLAKYKRRYFQDVRVKIIEGRRDGSAEELKRSCLEEPEPARSRESLEASASPGP